jgi:hypothetical protein
MSRPIKLVLSLSILLAACSGDDTSSTAPQSQSDGAAPDHATGGDADASVTTGGDGSSGSDVSPSEASDASTEGEAGMPQTEAGAPDAGGSDRAAESAVEAAPPSDASEAGSDASLESGAESGSEGSADAADEVQTDAASDAPLSDAPLDVDVSGGTVLLLGGGGATVFTGEFHGSSWATSTLGDVSDEHPAVALNNASSGVGVIRSNNNGGELRFTTWSPGRFGGLSAVGSGATDLGAPALVASATRVDLAFHGVDNKHYYARFTGTWNPTAEPIGTGVDQSFGPTPPAITLLGGDPVVALADDSGLLVDRTRVAGVWQGVHAQDLGDAGASVTVTPTVITPASGPELMIAFVRAPDQDVFFTTRSGGTWAAPQAVSGAFTADPVALLPLSGGDVILVVRSTDTHAYWARYSGGVWSALMGFPWFDVAVASTPALAPGIGGTDAEIAFVDAATGEAKHGRLTGSTWGSLATVGGTGLTSVSIASAP